MLGVCSAHKLQAVVYDILPSTTAVFSYSIGFRKLSVNEQFFVGDIYISRPFSFFLSVRPHY